MSKQNYVCNEDERFGNLLSEVYEGCDTFVLATAMVPTKDEPVVNTDEYDDPEDHYLIILSSYMSVSLEVYRVDKYGNYPLEYSELDEVSLDNVDAHPSIYREDNSGWGQYTLAIDMIASGRFNEWVADRRRIRCGTFYMD